MEKYKELFDCGSTMIEVYLDIIREVFPKNERAALEIARETIDKYPIDFKRFVDEMEAANRCFKVLGICGVKLPTMAEYAEALGQKCARGHRR